MTTPRFLPEMGGVERHVREVAVRLAKSGCEVTVLTTDRSRRLPAAERRDGFDIVRVHAWPKNADVYFAPGLGSHIRSGRWDLVHVQSYHTLVAPLAMWNTTRSRLPLIVTFHGGGHSSWLRRLIRGPQRAALRPLLSRAARLVAVAEFEVEMYSRELSLPRERFVVIPNGVDLAPEGVSRAPTKDLIIASIGRLERYKGHHRAIKALPYLLELEPDARLWIAGTGPYEAQLRRLAHRLGVEDRVEIRAIVSEDPAVMRAALESVSLVVLLSDFETHPLAALEARAAGCRLVVADNSGLRSLAEEGQARAVPLTASPSAWAAAMAEQLRAAPPPPPRFATWEECAARLRALYASVLDHPPCAS